MPFPSLPLRRPRCRRRTPIRIGVRPDLGVQLLRLQPLTPLPDLPELPEQRRFAVHLQGIRRVDSLFQRRLFLRESPVPEERETACDLLPCLIFPFNSVSGASEIAMA